MAKITETYGIGKDDKSKKYVYTADEVDAIKSALQTQITNHTHDNRYYTESESRNMFCLPVGMVIFKDAKASNGGMKYGTWEYLGSSQINLRLGTEIVSPTWHVYKRTA